GDAEAPVEGEVVDGTPDRGERDALGLPRAGEHLLGQRRPVVWQVGLVTDHRDRAVEALFAQRLGRAKAGQRRADDRDRGGEGQGSSRGLWPASGNGAPPLRPWAAAPPGGSPAARTGSRRRGPRTPRAPLSCRARCSRRDRSRRPLAWVASRTRATAHATYLPLLSERAFGS